MWTADCKKKKKKVTKKKKRKFFTFEKIGGGKGRR